MFVGSQSPAGDKYRGDKAVTNVIDIAQRSWNLPRFLNFFLVLISNTNIIHI